MWIYVSSMSNIAASSPTGIKRDTRKEQAAWMERRGEWYHAEYAGYEKIEHEIFDTY